MLAPKELSVVYVSRFLMGVNMSKTRAPPSGANPSNLVEERIDTEDDVLHIQVFLTSIELGWLIVSLTQCTLRGINSPPSFFNLSPRKRVGLTSV